MVSTYLFSKQPRKRDHKKVAGLLIDSRSFERRLMQLQDALNTLVNHALKVLHSAEHLRRAVMMKWTCNIMKQKDTQGRCNLLLDPHLTSLHLCFLTFSLWFRLIAPEPTTKLCFFALSRLPRLTPHNANPVDRPPVLVSCIASRCRKHMETPKNASTRTSRMRAGVSCGFGSGSGLGLNHKYR